MCAKVGRCGAKVASSVSSERSTWESRGQVFYTWQYAHGVDAKRRIQLPAKWRSPQTNAVYSLTLWPHEDWDNACVMVLPHEQWLALVKSLQETKSGDPNAEVLRRSIGRKSVLVELDKAGRFCLPEEMTKATEIGSDALLVGMVDRFQIWSPARFEKVQNSDKAASGPAFRLI